MTFNKEQIKRLEAFEPYFQTAVRSDWCRYPGPAGLQVIHSIFCIATGDRRRLNSGCQTCVLNLIRDCGRAYFADKAELAKRVTASEETAEKISRVKVETSNPQKRAESDPINQSGTSDRETGENTTRAKKSSKAGK